MKIAFLGTAAATSYPLVFCQCESCRAARTRGGPDLRKRSSLLVNDDLLIDLGPDVMSASFMHGVSMTDVRYCLQTHSHSDHFDASHFATRHPGYAVEGVPVLELFASRATLTRMSRALADEGSMDNLMDPKQQRDMNLTVHPVEAMQSFLMGRYRVSAFAANHDDSIESLLYAIAEDGFTLFYGTDTDVIPEQTWRGFHDHRLRFDIVVLDHTYGPDIDGDSHLNANKFIDHVRRMRDENLLAANARVFATHISHEGNPPHAEMVEYGKEHGYEIAYDGLTI